MEQPLPENLVCPITHSKLVREEDTLVSRLGGLRYPIREGLPILLPSAAILPERFHTLEDFKAEFATHATGNPTIG